MLRFWDWGWPVHIDAIKWMILNAATSTAPPGKQCPWSFVHQMIGVQPGSLEITLQTKQRRRGSMLQLRFPIWPLMLTLWPPWLPVSEFPAAASGNVLATSSAMNPKRRCLASTSRLRWRSRGNVFYGPRKLCSPATQSFGVGFTKHQAWSSTILAATAAGSTPSVQKDFTLTNGKGWKMLKKRPWSTNIHGPCCCSPFASNRMGFISGYYSCTLSIEAELSAAVFALVNSWAPHF